MSQLGVVTIVAIITGIVIGMSAYFIFRIPDIICIILGGSTCLVFFFITLWGTFIHYSRAQIENANN